MNRKRAKVETLISILYIFILYFFTYMIKYDNLSVSFKTIQTIINSQEFQYIVVGYLIILSLFIIFKGIVKDNLKTNIIVTFIVMVITIISYYKYKILELPFVPNDVLLIGNIKQIASFGLSLPSVEILLILIVIILLLFLQYLLRNKNCKNESNFKKDILWRISCFVIGIFLLYNICISPNRFIRLNIQNDLGNDYSWMGGNATFFIHLGDFYFQKPNDYSKEKIEEIKADMHNDEEEAKQENPNVILIMNESFSDPTKLKNVEYSKDPLGDIRNIILDEENSKMGEIISPVIGGGTSLPEFEVLTGLTSYFLPEQTFPYTSYIRSNMNSIVREYKKNGYYTVGIHTNTRTFYNRKNVYKWLGFENTIFSEDIKDAEYKGGNISDNEFASQVIEQFENNKQKKFIFGVTMQNHMPYSNKNYEYYDVDVNTEDLTENEIIELKNYVQGVYDGNIMYLKLMDYIKKCNEPTILVMFGDHIPSLSNYTVYEKSNYTDLQYHETPYIIYANYDANFNNIPQYMSPSTLGIEIMKSSAINIPWYLEKFKDLYSAYPVITNSNIINKYGEVVNEVLEEHTTLLNQCEIIQYDLLIKKKYIEIE